MNYENDKKILRNSYVPTRAKFYNKHDKGDLDTRLQQDTYNEIISNSDEYFEKVTITNFDLMHHQCRGDKLTHDREYYETLFKKKVNLELNNQLHKYIFLSLAQRCERKDVYFQKDLQKDHFNRTLVKEQLKKWDFSIIDAKTKKNVLMNVNLFLSKKRITFFQIVIFKLFYILVVKICCATGNCGAVSDFLYFFYSNTNYC